ncbi:MAG: hydantoinase/oxoprolinase family protein, partial [Thermomicrobiales bacterium]
GLAGGAIPIHQHLAEEAVQRAVATPLGLSLLDAAWGAHTVANSTMIRAIKAVTTYRGRDPRDFALMAFGGNGPIHATGVAESLGIQTVIVPPAPGLFSAVGLLEAKQERHFTQSLFGPFDRTACERIDTGFRDLEARAAIEIAREEPQSASLSFQRGLDLRYAGQGFELAIAVGSMSAASEWFERVTEAFTREHERTYGHSAPGEPMEIVNVRLIAQRDTNLIAPTLALTESTQTASADRLVYFGAATGMVSVPVLDRRDLASTDQRGPLIIQEYDSTTIVPPNAAARRDEHGNIIVTLDSVDA